MSFSRDDAGHSSWQRDARHGTIHRRPRVEQVAARDSLQRTPPPLHGRFEVDMPEHMFDTGFKEYRPGNGELQPRTAPRATRRRNERQGAVGTARAVFAGAGEARDE